MFRSLQTRIAPKAEMRLRHSSGGGFRDQLVSWFFSPLAPADRACVARMALGNVRLRNLGSHHCILQFFDEVQTEQNALSIVSPLIAQLMR